MYSLDEFIVISNNSRIDRKPVQMWLKIVIIVNIK